jgi:gamma-glutamyltranspeptidase/glutathione hydrolase
MGQIRRLLSERKPINAKNGMVATSQPLASQAGLDILKKGGNAIDAAIAVAACLTVVEPTSNGIGGDNFALIWHGENLYGLNSSGHAPLAWSLDYMKKNALQEIPKYGFVPVTVPGAVAGWAEMHKRFGKLSFLEVLSPAIHYARNGFTVSPTVAEYWNLSNQNYKKNLKGPEFAHWFDTFTVDGKAPDSGETFFLKDHANTLEEIAKTYGESFYKGKLADQIDAFSRKHQGLIRKSDLASFHAKWVTPISINYKGYNVWEIPPNGQGAVALMALNIVESFKFKNSESISRIHHQVEAMKLAFADGHAYISDPSSMKTDVEDLLSKSYSKQRAKLIGPKAEIRTEGIPKSSGTVYFAVADQEGNMVSMIQSNYMGFGSGLVVPNTGIALHNRGHNFSLDPSSDNCLSPGKRPYHTIIPGFLTKGREAIGPFGVMGGFMQPQGHLQVVMNMIDFDMDPQRALDAPRWQWMEGNRITLEPGFREVTIEGLIQKGHIVEINQNLGSFGRGQIIFRDLITKVYQGGTEKRCDGTISSY